jgi:flagellar hook-associated protein 1 FlgK
MLNSINENRVIWADSKGIAVDNTGADLMDNPSGPAYDVNQLALFQPSDGQLAGYTSVQRDIDNYIDDLNKLAKSLALAVNTIQSGQTNVMSTDSSGNILDSTPFFVNGDVAQYDANNNLTNLVSPPAVQGTLNNEAGITAGNISVNKAILSNVMNIKTRTSDDQFASESSNTVEGPKDGARAQAISDLKNTLMNIDNVTAVTTRSSMFGGTLSNHGMTIANSSSGMTMDNYFKDVIDKLGIQSQEAQNLSKSQSDLLENFTEQKAGISGVSIDEETANLVQYQHAYQANAKVIATVDELLDVVKNGLKK